MKRNTKKRHIEEHEESWAVSYADLLMVLMSFFIVFFNLEQGKGEDSIVEVISQSFKGEKAKGSKNRGVSSVGLVGGIIQDLKGQQIAYRIIDQNGDVIKDGAAKGIIIELPDDIFSVGEHDLRSDTKLYIDEILEKVMNYKEQITVIAIGHSDTIPMRREREVIKSNFILSSLRAAKAVDYIVKKGFDRNWVLGQAVSVQNRATRSLSIKILERN